MYPWQIWKAVSFTLVSSTSPTLHSIVVLDVRSPCEHVNHPFSLSASIMKDWLDSWGHLIKFARALTVMSVSRAPNLQQQSEPRQLFVISAYMLNLMLMTVMFKRRKLSKCARYKNSYFNIIDWFIDKFYKPSFLTTNEADHTSGVNSKPWVCIW